MGLGTRQQALGKEFFNVFNDHRNAFVKSLPQKADT